MIASYEYPWFDQVLLQDTLSSQCDLLDLDRTPPSTKVLDHILVDHKHKLLYCYVPKVIIRIFNNYILTRVSKKVCHHTFLN